MCTLRAATCAKQVLPSSPLLFWDFGFNAGPKKVHASQQVQKMVLCGKPPSWIARIESKERRLDVVEFIALARALKLKEVDLLRTISTDLPKKLEI